MLIGSDGADTIVNIDNSNSTSSNTVKPNDSYQFIGGNSTQGEEKLFWFGHFFTLRCTTKTMTNTHTNTHIHKYTNEKCLKDPSCAIFPKSMGSRILNLTFPCDMVDMDMVDIDMVDMDMAIAIDLTYGGTVYLITQSYSQR